MNWTSKTKKEISEEIRKRISKSFDYYSPLHSDWSVMANDYENLPSRNNLFSSTEEEVRVALSWMVIDGVIASMTDGRPKPVFLPGNRAAIEKSEMLSRIMVGPIWEDLELDEQNEDVLRMALAVSGAVVTRPGVDFRGQLRDIFYDPQHCFPEPMIRDLKNMTYFGTRVPYPIGEIKRMFPDEDIHSEPIEPLYDMGSFYNPTVGHYMDWDSKKMLPNWQSGDEKGDYMKRFDSDDRAFLTHVWLADYGVGEIPYDDEETMEENEKSQGTKTLRTKWWENHAKHINAHRQLYAEIAAMHELEIDVSREGVPNIYNTPSSPDPQLEQDIMTLQRLQEHIKEHANYPIREKGLVNPHGVEVWMANDKVLNVSKAKFGNPYVSYQFDRSVKRSFWGRSLMHYMRPLNNQFNIMVDKISKHANVVANGRCYYNARLQILWDKVRKKAKGRVPVGMYIPTKGSPRDNILWDYGGTMPPYVFQLLGAIEQWCYKIGGFTEVMQGGVPAYASGAAMGRALQSAGVRIRKGVKHLGWYYREKFRRYIHFMTMASDAQVFRIVGPENETEFVAYQDIDWDAWEDVRIDTRNMIGTWREEQFEKLSVLLQKAPHLAELIIPALAQYLDIPIDTQNVQRTQQLENALSITHDQMGQMNAQIDELKNNTNQGV